MDKAAVGEMNNVTTTQLAASTISHDTMASSVSTQPSPRINLPPPPNPPFTFPARPSSSAPSSLSRTTGRRHQSAIDIPKIGLAVDPSDSDTSWDRLPNFSFNPGNELSPERAGRRPRPPPLPSFSFNPGETPATDSSLLSPSFPPLSPRTIPNHMGHRRGGSEFVGGKLKSGEPITLMSTSPTRSESGFASPSLAPTSGPRKHQRGHSHRRSGAISSHDLSLILQASPSPSSRGSSAPTSPSGFRDQYTFPGVKDQKPLDTNVLGAGEATASEEVVVPNVVPEKPSQSMPELTPKPATRARVGFSDTLEFIPRPLSLVSTDTASTVRPGHSVSGSISSIASITNSTNPDRDSSAILSSPVPRTKPSSRPSTAGAVLERTSSLQVDAEGSSSARRRNSMLMLNDLAGANLPTSAMSTPTRTPKRWTFFGFDSFATAGSPTRPRPASTSSSETAAKEGANIMAPIDNVDVTVENTGSSQDASPVEEKKKSGKKRQKRVKSWAGSILTRKSKSRAQKSKARRRSQTPPIPRFVKDEEMDYDFAETTDQSSGTEMGTSSSRPMSSSSRKGKHRETFVEDDVPYPMIDLDAALGPFNTPTRDPQWEEAQKAGATPKRQLHSAAGMRGFSGPGMHYHRRAESAPEMPPFEGGRFSIHRFGSSSTMADVFEEDEEEEDSHTGESAAEDSTSESQSTTTGDEDEARDTDDAASTPRQERGMELADSQTDISMVSSAKRKGSSSSLPAPRKISNANSSSSLHREAIATEQTYPIPPRKEAMSTTPLEISKLVATSPPAETNQIESIPPDATSIILPGPPMMPISPYSIGQSSSFPSPRSPMSYDAHRISTAPSSVTDENQYHSLLMGEPGPELVRLSIDVPSITSTNSTMTRESLFPGVQPRNMPFHEQRPASFTASAFGRRRSSLASLSRLISSAHGERSKLSMEVPFENEEDKKSKTSRSKRLARIMKFWKPRASSSS
ncbi:hypothetical protein FHL15_001406 [Xylaria flabelliformis]|uniref:Cell wall proline rich protein n=1 Tax=Xylaria flabelliformis TaxID=2512241 RepID=A0A553IBS2_9PEZI|nr:hypothetical protein FHL15_001406 [Xylaria flabelliformis]